MSTQEALGHVMLLLPDWVRWLWRTASPGLVLVAAYLFRWYIVALGLLLLPCVLALSAGLEIRHRTWPMIATCATAGLLGGACSVSALLAVGLLQSLVASLLGGLMIAGLHHSFVCRCNLARLMRQRWLLALMMAVQAALWWLALDPTLRLGIYHALLARAGGLGLVAEGAVRAAAAAAAAAEPWPQLRVSTVAALLARGSITPLLLLFTVTWLEDYRLCLNDGGPASLTSAQPSASSGLFHAANRYDLDWLLLRSFAFVGVLCCTGSVRHATTANIALHGVFMLVRLVASNRHLLQLFREESAAGAAAATAAQAAVAAAASRTAAAGATAGRVAGNGAAPAPRALAAPRTAGVFSRSPQRQQLPLSTTAAAAAAGGRAAGTAVATVGSSPSGRPRSQSHTEPLRIRPVVVRPEDTAQEPASTAARQAAATGQPQAGPTGPASRQVVPLSRTDPAPSAQAALQSLAGAGLPSAAAMAAAVSGPASNASSSRVGPAARAPEQPGGPAPRAQAFWVPINGNLPPHVPAHPPPETLAPSAAAFWRHHQPSLMAALGLNPSQPQPSRPDERPTAGREQASGARASTIVQRGSRAAAATWGASGPGAAPAAEATTGSGSEAGEDSGLSDVSNGSVGAGSHVGLVKRFRLDAGSATAAVDSYGVPDVATPFGLSAEDEVPAEGHEASAAASAAAGIEAPRTSAHAAAGANTSAVKAASTRSGEMASGEVAAVVPEKNLEVPEVPTLAAASVTGAEAGPSTAADAAATAALTAAAPAAAHFPAEAAEAAPKAAATTGDSSNGGGGTGGLGAQAAPAAGDGSSVASPHATDESVAAPASPPQPSSPAVSWGSIVSPAVAVPTPADDCADSRPPSAHAVAVQAASGTEQPSVTPDAGPGDSGASGAAPSSATDTNNADSAAEAAGAGPSAPPVTSGGVALGTPPSGSVPEPSTEAPAAAAASPVLYGGASASLDLSGGSAGKPAIMRFVGRPPSATSPARVASSARGQSRTARGADSRARGAGATGGAARTTTTGSVGRFGGRGAAPTAPSAPGAPAVDSVTVPPTDAAAARPATNVDGGFASGAAAGTSPSRRPGVAAGSRAGPNGSSGRGAALGSSNSAAGTAGTGGSPATASGNGIGRFGGRGADAAPLPPAPAAPRNNSATTTTTTTAEAAASVGSGGAPARPAGGAVPSGGNARAAAPPPRRPAAVAIAPVPAAAVSAAAAAAASDPAAAQRPQMGLVYLRGRMFDDVVLIFNVLVLALWSLYMPPWSALTRVVVWLLGSWDYVCVLAAAIVAAKLLRMSRDGKLRRVLRPCGSAGRAVDVEAQFRFNLGVAAMPLVVRLLTAVWPPLAFAYLALATNTELAARAALVMLQPIRFVGALPLSGLPLLPFLGMALFPPSAMQPIPVWPCVTGAAERRRGAVAAVFAAALGLDPALSKWLGLLLAHASTRADRHAVTRRRSLESRLAKFVVQQSRQTLRFIEAAIAWLRHDPRATGLDVRWARAPLMLGIAALGGLSALVAAVERRVAAIQAEAEDPDDLDGPGPPLYPSVLARAESDAVAAMRRRQAQRQREAAGSGGGGSGGGGSASDGTAQQRRGGAAAGNRVWTLSSSSGEEDDGGAWESQYNLELARTALRRRVHARRSAA